MATRKAASTKRLGGEGSSAPSDMFELVTRALNVAYYEWIAETDEYHFSPALLQLFGYKPEDITPPTLWEAMHPDDREGVRAGVAGFFRSREERAEFTYRLRMPTGESKWAHAYAVAQRDPNGMVTRVVGALSDITEAKQREAENRALIARQAASIQVLKIISASPDNPQPVFDLIARSGIHLCPSAQRCSVTEHGNGMLRLRASHGHDAARLEVLRQEWPQPITADTVHGRVALTGRIVHICDVEADGAEGHLRDLSRTLGTRSLVGVPLLRDGQTIGSIVVSASEPNVFHEGEVALLESFAEQAVIAIGSAQTLGELRQRTRDLTESLEQQIATADVLKAISRSAFDLDTVLDTLTRSAGNLCGAATGMIHIREGEQFRVGASFGHSRDYRRWRQTNPLRPGRDSTAARVLLSHVVEQVNDIQA